MPFTIQSIYLVRTSLFTFEAIGEMVCKHKNKNKFLIQLRIEDKGLFRNITPQRCGTWLLMFETIPLPLSFGSSTLTEGQALFLTAWP